MLTLPIVIITLLPQLVAGLRRKGPAAHLTLLLLSICAVTTLITVLTLSTPPAPTSRQTYYMVHLPPLVWPVLGLCLLTPFYWAVEHVCSARDLRLDSVLVQALALTMAVALWGEAQGTSPLVIEFGASALVLALLSRGTWQLAQARTLK